MTVKEALISLSTYPIPDSTIEMIAGSRGQDLAATYSQAVNDSKEYRLCKADVMKWLSGAPSINEGGIQIGLLISVREDFRKKANAIYKEYDDSEYISGNQTFIYEGTEV